MHLLMLLVSPRSLDFIYSSWDSIEIDPRRICYKTVFAKTNLKHKTLNEFSNAFVNVVSNHEIHLFLFETLEAEYDS